MEVQFKTKDNPEVRKANYDLPESLDDLVEKFGADVVAENARANIVISLQSLGRRHIGKKDDEIQAVFDAWVPGERSAAVKLTPAERAAKALKALSPEERAAFLASLQG